VSKPFQHQVEAIKFLKENSAGALFDEMGLGKSFCTIATAQDLFESGLIDKVIVVVPAAVRMVWFDPELGELAKHHENNMRVIEYHSKQRVWTRGDLTKPYLTWFITNYDYLRCGDTKRRNPLEWSNLKPLADLVDEKTWLVLDESSAIKNFKAKQTKAIKALRSKCGRVTLLNGTPISHSPGDLYSQADIMSPKILGLQNYYQFRARYAFMGGFKRRQIVGWYHPFKTSLIQDSEGNWIPLACCEYNEDSSIHCRLGEGLEDLQARLKPFVMRREKIDCLDLPPKLPSVSREVRLTPATWRMYKQMRTEFVAWLNDASAAEASQAGVRSMRLAQITSGFLGGILTEHECECGTSGMTFDRMLTLEDGGALCKTCAGSGIRMEEGELAQIGSEKFDSVMAFLEERAEMGEKVLLWCRFRFEVERFLNAIKVPVGAIWGGQKRNERADAIRLLDPRTAPKGPAVVVGTPASGSMGLNLTSAWCVMYVSNDHSLKTRLQSEDRVHRMGQTMPVSYFDVVAVGPQGQRTIDHLVVKSLQKKQHVAKMTIEAWKKEMENENIV